MIEINYPHFIATVILLGLLVCVVSNIEVMHATTMSINYDTSLILDA